jgi:molybdopterin-guanine dinucleotide biosynthesis protein A
MARHPEACEPLAAIYPAEALAAVEARIAGGDFSLQGLARQLAAAGRMHLISITGEEAGRLQSLNTPARFAAWREQQGTGTPPSVQSSVPSPHHETR